MDGQSYRILKKARKTGYLTRSDSKLFHNEKHYERVFDYLTKETKYLELGFWDTESKDTVIARWTLTRAGAEAMESHKRRLCSQAVSIIALAISFLALFKAFLPEILTLFQ